MKFTKMIKKNEDFVRLIQKGKWFSGNLMTLYVIQNAEKENQLGISVSKKYAKSSVKRNRVRRLIKEAYRLQEEQMPMGVAILVLWKNKVPAEKVNWYEIKSDLEQCLHKAKLLKK